MKFKYFGFLLLSLFLFSCKEEAPKRLELFFLGHDSKHHDSEQLAEILSQEYFKDGFNITYSTDPEDLTSDNLKRFDGLILYANHDTISAEQETALLDFVASGKGFIPIHSASFCFQNSPEAIALIGGQFKSHEGGSFSAEIIKPDHPAMKGVESFTTEWDETYVHDKIADDIEVLMERVEDGHREPYTWVKEHGKGRVFYTAFGHDERTFRNPGFLQLIKSGILWAVGDAAVERLNKFVIAEASYEDAHLPNYEKRDPAPKYQLPLSPEESQSLVQVPVGFRLELFASEPDIKKPIAMDWDEKGRLWIIETVDYPNTVRNDKGEGDDRILILEDTDGDGKADKFTEFAAGLNIPTGFVFANGGIIVSQAPYFLFLKDEDGDDKADVREVLIEGWGTFDTHAGPSNLRYGLDNKIWGTVGYSGFEGIIGGEEFKFGSGIYHFEPDASEFEFLTFTTNNTWGLGFSEEFDVFISTANNEHSNFFAIPNRYYAEAEIRGRGAQKIDSHYGMHVVTKNLRQVDVHGGFTAAAGHSLYTARTYPKEYWNRVAFINEPTGRVIHKHVLEQEGSGFVEGPDGWNLVASADEWFGPVEAKVGPDGSVWFLDWYNFIIQHNPTPEGAENGEGNAYIDPLRDNTRGRIYRLVYEDAEPSDSYSLDKEDTAGLLDALQSDNMFWRTTAQRLLVESGDQSVADELYNIIQAEQVDEINVDAPAIHALWTLQGLGLLEHPNQESTDVLFAALNHPSGGVRRAAVQLVPANDVELINRLIDADVLSDSDLRVRLAAILKLADAQPSEEVAQAILEASQVSENQDDKWISEALKIAETINSDYISLAQKNIANTSRGGTEGEVGIDETITIKVIVGEMKYDKTKFSVKAGSKVKIVLENPDFMQHNLLIIKPGSLEKVGKAADEVAMQTNGAELQYIPDIPEVLFSTPLVNPEDKTELVFTVPEQTGDYPFVCTFPGHWRIMNGVMTVTK